MWPCGTTLGALSQIKLSLKSKKEYLAFNRRVLQNEILNQIFLK